MSRLTLILRRRVVTGVAAWLMLAVPLAAPAGTVGEALRAGDIDRLEALARGTDAEAGLARALALALRRQDAAALPALERLAGPKQQPPQRVLALQTLAALQLRNSRFSAAREALAASDALEPLDAEGRQTLVFADALADVPPMRAAAGATGRLPVRRDAASLARVTAQIDGQAQDAVVDTGAAFSTITTSTAQRLGLTLLKREASVSSASRDAVTTRFAVARELRLGEAVLHDVVFIVLPDEALSFNGGSYRIDAILGLPVFLQLGRLAVEKGPDEAEQLSLGTAAPSGAGGAPLIMLGLEPMLLAGLAPDAQGLRLFVDTGARHSQLFRNVAEQTPALLQQAVSQALTVGGAGGSRTDSQALKLPTLALQVGTRRVQLADVPLLSRTAVDREGVVGQDVLRQGRGYVMDFEQMRLRLLP
ncbi:retropepsin-like aspartic protease family protein [Roseateles cellulosilyticus]|uniref:Retropepsin-like domain-containing protein n=1 Tax=Pelomonas cellulosilytica TaxID=2906762 RepID=A0ABS8XT25_9BURK|nr:retropepsin-like aspartic protease [Pelomonas sp. P8]MCE4554343.1 retropepsin-like domain-containing protein [Pelomonas sp. P8]